MSKFRFHLVWKMTIGNTLEEICDNMGQIAALMAKMYCKLEWDEDESETSDSQGECKKWKQPSMN